jgi:dCTP diphosphatase
VQSSEIDTLTFLTGLAERFRAARDWKQFHNLKDMVISLTLESSELLELTQWKNGDLLAESAADKREQFAHELADVLYWTLLIAKELDIDLKQSFQEKMALNEAKYPLEKVKGSYLKYTEL